MKQEKIYNFPILQLEGYTANERLTCILETNLQLLKAFQNNNYTEQRMKTLELLQETMILAQMLNIDNADFDKHFINKRFDEAENCSMRINGYYEIKENLYRESC